MNSKGPNVAAPALESEVLRLTGPLRLAARAVVEAYRTIDWAEIDRSELDKVFVNFSDERILKRADDLVHLIAFADRDTVRAVIVKFKSYEKSVLPPLRDFIQNLSGELEKHPSARRSGPIRKFRSVLTKLSAALTKCIGGYRRSLEKLNGHLPEQEIWRIWQVLNQRLTEAREIQNQVIRTILGLNDGFKKRAQPPFAFASLRIPPPGSVRVTESGDDWLIIPLVLASAPKIFRLCQKIAGCDSTFNEIRVPGCLMQAARNYTEFLTGCVVVGFEVPDDEDPRIARRLQQDLDRLLTALFGFLNSLPANPHTAEFEGDSARPEPSKGMPLTPDVETAPKHQKPMVEGMIDGECKQTPAHEITINDAFVIQVDGEPVRHDLCRRTLLGLAICAEEAKGEAFLVNGRNFISAVEGTDKNSSRRRYARFRELKKYAPSFLPNSVGDGEYEIKGLHFVYKPSGCEIEAYLKKHPFARRQKPASQ